MGNFFLGKFELARLLLITQTNKNLQPGADVARRLR